MEIMQVPETKDISTNNGGRSHSFPLHLLGYALLILVALAPRVFYLYEAVDIPLFHHLYLDAESYDNWAQELASGHWVGERAFHMAPLYPYLLGIFYRVAGHTLLGVRIVHHLLGTVGVLFLFLVARRLFGGRVAVISFFLALGYGPLLFFEGQVLASVLGTTLGIISLYALLRSCVAGGRGLFFAGLLLGIGSVARPNLLFFLPLVLIWMLMRERFGFRGTALYLAGFLIALLPPVVHNYHVSNDFIPISSHGGISFYLGNGPYTQGTYVPPPEFGGNPEAIDIYDSRRIAERELGRPLKASEISNYWYGESFRFMRENPGSYLRLFARKISLYFNEFEIPLDVNYNFDRRLYHVFRFTPFTFGLLLPLAMVGTALLFRRKGRGWLLVLFLLANAASVIAFFICTRYRLTGMPAVVILAAFALDRMVEDLRLRRWRSFSALTGLLLLFALPVHLDLYPGRISGEARSFCVMGRAYAAEGENEVAERAFLDALEILPNHVDAHMNLGTVLYRTGRYREAAESFRNAVAAAPDFAGAWNNLGNALREAGEPALAVSAIREAIAMDPGYAGAYGNLGYTLDQMNRWDEAEAAYRTAVRVAPGSAHALANHVDFLVGRGRFDEALLGIAGAVETFSENSVLQRKLENTRRGIDHYRRATALLDAGDQQGTLRALAKAVERGREPMRRWIEVDPVLEPVRNPPEEGRGGEDR